MPDTTPLTPADVAREVQRLADALFPDMGLHAELHVFHPGGRVTVVCGAGAAAATLTERQHEILQALEEAGGRRARLTGAAVAKLAGLPFDGHFREDLAALKRLGRVVNHSPGYSLPG